LANYETILKRIKSESPDTIVYIQSILPVNNDILKIETVDEQEIILINEKLKTFADGKKNIFINLYPSFCGADNKLYRKYAGDGLHPSSVGYDVWGDLIIQYVK
jgi:lysophospholipase L1-like esterase